MLPIQPVALLRVSWTFKLEELRDSILIGLATRTWALAAIIASQLWPQACLFKARVVASLVSGQVPTLGQLLRHLVCVLLGICRLGDLLRQDKVPTPSSSATMRESLPREMRRMPRPSASTTPSRTHRTTSAASCGGVLTCCRSARQLAQVPPV